MYYYKLYDKTNLSKAMVGAWVDNWSFQLVLNNTNSVELKFTKYDYFPLWILNNSRLFKIMWEIKNATFLHVNKIIMSQVLCLYILNFDAYLTLEYNITRIWFATECTVVCDNWSR